MPGYFLLTLLLAAPTERSIRAQVFNSPLVIHTSARTAGAIDSIKFRGKEFVNAYDHGREWQSAVSYDGLGECFNPTEAGSNQDGAGPNSSSEVIDAHTADATLYTSTKMAYWLQPDEPHKPACTAARNKAALSEDTLLKQAAIGYNGMPNVIEYLITLNAAEPHQATQFEALTGYMPPEFSLFLTFNPATSQLAPLTNGPGEQELPIIFATRDRMFAAGIYSPDPGAGYGRFSFVQHPEIPGWNTVKWNAVFRAKATKPGPYVHRCFVAIGTVEEVRKALQQLVGQ